MRNHVRCALTSFATFVAAAIVFIPSAGHAQNACKTELHQGSDVFRNGDTVCQTAVNRKCSFNLALCINQGTGCTPEDLKKKKKVKATGNCPKKLTTKASGTAAECGSSATIKLKTKKHKTQASTCMVKVKAGTDISSM